MEALSESFIFYKADHFDIVGKQLLKTNSKWFIVDWDLVDISFRRSGMFWDFQS